MPNSGIAHQNLMCILNVVFIGNCPMKYLCQFSFLPEGCMVFATIHKDCQSMDKTLVPTHCLEVHVFPKVSTFICHYWYLGLLCEIPVHIYFSFFCLGVPFFGVSFN